MKPWPTTLHLLLLALLLLGLTACGGGGGGVVGDPPPSGFTVSGTVSASSGVAVDRDVNDPHAPFATNDDCATAQPLPNPVTLGGYLNAPRAGSGGRSFAR
ncbi:MAG: hypothetical protein ACNA74_02715 [Desulfurivibrio sp.]